MSKSEAVNWQIFKQMLLQHPTLHLQFQYAFNKWVAPSYHITEIKQAPIISVDCGGVINNWTEIILQLWEPETPQQQRAMNVHKALSIIELVEKAMPLNQDAMVKIEFGNSQFDTRQMLVNHMVIDGQNLVINLQPDAVQCKAIERGGSCGTDNKGEECCAPVANKPKIALLNLATEAASCTPGSGCC